MKKMYVVIGTIAILHDGKRYGKGDQIELAQEEAERIALYVKLDEDADKRKQAEAEAEKARLAAEKAERLAAEDKAKKEAEKAAKAAEKELQKEKA